MDKLMKMMGDNDCVSLELGDLKITRLQKIDLQTDESTEPSDEEILDNPYAGLK